MKGTLRAGRMSTRPVLWALLAGAAFAVLAVGAKVSQAREAAELAAVEQAARAEALEDQAQADARQALAEDLKAHPEKYRAAWRHTYQPSEREQRAMADFGGARGQQTLAAAYNGSLSISPNPICGQSSALVASISASALGGGLSIVNGGGNSGFETWMANGPPLEHAADDPPEEGDPIEGHYWHGWYWPFVVTVSAPGDSDTLTLWLWAGDMYGYPDQPGLPTGAVTVTSLTGSFTIGLTGAYRRAKLTDAIPADHANKRDVRQTTGTGHWFADASTTVNVAATVAGQSLAASGNYGAAGETDLTEGLLLGVSIAENLNYAPEINTDYGIISVYAGAGTDVPVDFSKLTFYRDTDNSAWHWHGASNPPPAAANIDWYTQISGGNSISLRRGEHGSAGASMSHGGNGGPAAVKVVPRLWKTNKEATTVSGSVERYTSYDTTEGHPFDLGLYIHEDETAADVSRAPDWDGELFTEFWWFGSDSGSVPDSEWRKFTNLGNGLKIRLRKDWLVANNEDVVFTDPATMKDLPRLEGDPPTPVPLADILQPLTFHPLDGKLDDPPWRADWIAWLRVERNLDQPAGATSRPSPWTGVGAVDVTGNTWTIPAAGGVVERTLATRRRNRIGRMNAHLWTGTGDQQEVSHDWPLMTRANLAFAITGDDAKWWDPNAEPWPGEEVGVEFEDVTDWRMFSCVRLHVTGASADQVVTLRLTYRSLSGTDQNYTGAQWNFSPGDGTFEATWSDPTTATIAATLNHSTGYAVFDLAPDAGASPLDLELVEKVEFVFPEVSGEQVLTFSGWETVPYSGEGSSEARQRVAHKCSTDYWGTGLWVDGMPDYRPTYLYPLDSERVEVGFKNQQDQQPNPESEITDDLRSLKLLSRFVNEVQYAESLIEPTWGTAAIEASLKDASDDWLGLPYCGDMDEDGFCLHVGTDLDVFFPLHTVYCDVILQGGARGIAKSGGVRHIGASENLYLSTDGGATKTLVQTQSADLQGMVRLWSGKEKTPRTYYAGAGQVFTLGGFVNAEETWQGFAQFVPFAGVSHCAQAPGIMRRLAVSTDGDVLEEFERDGFALADFAEVTSGGYLNPEICYTRGASGLLAAVLERTGDLTDGGSTDIAYAVSTGTYQSGWGAVQRIRQNRVYPAACALPPTHDLFVVGIASAEIASDSIAYGQMLSWNGTSYDIGSEVLVVSGDITVSRGALAQHPGNRMEYIYADAAGDLQVVASTNGGKTWS